MNFSHSTVTELLDGCAYRAGLKSIVKLPSPPNGRLVVGSAVHAGIELHEAARMRAHRFKHPFELTLPDLMEEAECYIRKADDVDWTRDKLDPDMATQMANVALTNWWHTPIPEGQLGAGRSLRERVMSWQPLSVESLWRMFMPPHTSLPVVGYLDGMYWDPIACEVVLVDDKTSTGWSQWSLTDTSKNRAQPALYAAAAMRSVNLPGLPGRIPRFEYHIIRLDRGKNRRFEGVRVVPIEIDEVDLRWVEERFAEAHRRQRAGDWRKNPSSFFCNPNWCPFHVEAGGPCTPEAPNEFDIESYR